MNMSVRFRDIPINGRFRYDGDTFVKVDERIAWELRGNDRAKEWVFLANDQCKPINEQGEQLCLNTVLKLDW